MQRNACVQLVSTATFQLVSKVILELERQGLLTIFCIVFQMFNSPESLKICSVIRRTISKAITELAEVKGGILCRAEYNILAMLERLRTSVPIFSTWASRRQAGILNGEPLTELENLLARQLSCRSVTSFPEAATPASSFMSSSLGCLRVYACSLPIRFDTLACLSPTQIIGYLM